MRIKAQSVLIRCLLLSLLLTSLLADMGLAQTPTPLSDLKIRLWPEYDRQREVLVIFQGTVADDVSLPASVRFTLPKNLQALNAVAYLDETQGTLLNIPDYEFVEDAAGKVLSFTTPERQFHFEYYSSDLLNINGSVRTLSYSFTSSADIASLALEIQEPTTTQAFSSDPLPSTTEIGQEGLTVAFYDLGAVSSGDSYSLAASYTRSTDEPSAVISVPSSPEQVPVEVGSRGLKENLGPILIAAGALLLIGAFGYWFWSQRAVVVPEPTPRRSSPRSRRPSRKRAPSAPRSTDTPRRSHPPASDEPLAAYCHRCGTKFRDDALFCHACGAERRAG